THEETEEFFRSVPEFERMLVRSGIILVKYWFSITDHEQNLRFQMRIHDPLKQWKLSPMDLESRRRWEDYTKAKEEMLFRTHIPPEPLGGLLAAAARGGARQPRPPPVRPRAPPRAAAPPGPPRPQPAHTPPPPPGPPPRDGPVPPFYGRSDFVPGPPLPVQPP